MKLRTFIVFLFLSTNLLAAGLSSVEQQIADVARQNTDDSIALLEKVANINSGTMNHEGVKKVGAVFMEEFRDLGFDVKWIPQEQVNRAGHLFAERKGTQGKRLLLIGHLDTVFEKDSPFQPFTRNGDRAKGQGVNDMKGGDVIILYALKALKEFGALDNTSIIVAFTGDEEMPGDPIDISRKDLIDAGKRSDIALAFESAEGLDTGTIARRGIGSWTLTVHGKTAHSSGIFGEDGYGAVFEAARILNGFRSEMAGEALLTFNPAVILGGTEVTFDTEANKGTAFGKTNVIAQSVTVVGDLRTISDEQKEHALDRMKKIISQNLHGTSAEISFIDEYPGMAPTQKNKELLNLFDHVSRDLGYSAIVPLDPGKRGAGDVSFVAKYDACLDGLGAMGNGGHTPQEDIDLSAMTEQIQRAAILIYRLTRENAK